MTSTEGEFGGVQPSPTFSKETCWICAKPARKFCDVQLITSLQKIGEKLTRMR